MEKIILSHITDNIETNQHGFKTHHSTSTALHQLTNQITQGFNKPQPPDRTIVVSLDLSKAFDTVNIHTLIHKQTYHPPSSNTSQTTSKAGKDTYYTSMHHPDPNNSRPEFHKAESYHPPYSTSTPQTFQNHLRTRHSQLTPTT